METMEEALKILPKISNSSYWTEIFNSILLGNYPENIKITKTKFYYGDDYVNINKCKDIGDFYHKVVNMLKKYMYKDELWSNIRNNVKMDMIEKYCKKCAKKYELDDKTRENLFSVLRMILFSMKNCRSLITIKDGNITDISCITFSKGSFKVKHISSKQTYIFKQANKDIFNNSCKKFEKDLIKKLSYR